ncbi:DNA replication ATP-dependent helicase/nuclease dna2-like, partial [Homarus americanus]|uniref:DNA replication ATP-dependent helicase/nuclease dna2-like n=1 Tax=Homarus americanus TaxID=6706 RepID=UPI001C46620E
MEVLLHETGLRTLFDLFLTGVSLGIVTSAAPVYICEIAHSSVRGALSCVVQLGVNLGIFTAALLGTFVEWRGLAVFGAITVVLYFVATLFIPNSPVWLVSSGREDDARETLHRLRGHQYCVEYDLQQIISSKANQYDMVNSGNLGSWLQNIVEPSLERSVIFLDTCKAATEAHDNANVVNSRETQVVVTLVQAFIQAGLSVDAVGVITPFRAQVKQIRDHILKDVTMGQRVEVNTVDQYQGRDKDVIVYSCVRSGVTHCDVGDILQDERRLNVAVTRAKYKLIMVGDAATLHLYPPFRKLKSV